VKQSGAPHHSQNDKFHSVATPLLLTLIGTETRVYYEPTTDV